ncbi:MAG: serine/threonine protein kinase [Candidatus Riflebacteria bacterium]|nr:serine/threonine protein kinase [Candidatus Riflebacteria bacterium]
MGLSATFSDEFQRRYQIEKILGEGGVGRVYLARDTELARHVAIKVLIYVDRADPVARQRFEEEARVCAALKHPNIVPLYHVGSEGGCPYLVFEFVEGQDLARVLTTKKVLDAKRTLAIAADVLEGPAYAHARKVVHRDLKPGNILLREAGQSEIPMILDFGMAKTENRDRFQTRQGIVLGTPLYLAPEAIMDGRSLPATDLYSLGCVMFECLAGRPPFLAATDLAVLELHLEKPPPRLDEVDKSLPKALVELVDRALRKDPEDRFTAAEEMLAWVRAVQEGRPPPGSRTTRLPGSSALAASGSRSRQSNTVKTAARSGPGAPTLGVTGARAVLGGRFGWLLGGASL